jgi:hypothetical protein
MHAKNRPLIRWHFMMYLGIAMVLTACGAVTPAPEEATSLRLKNGAVEIQDQDHVWTPVGGETTFIEPAGEKAEAAITLIGKVDSVEPWMVGGIALDVTADTVITGKIVTNMIARVEILLGEDGSWEVISLTSLSSFTEIPGCATVAAKVVGVKGNEVQFAGWPPVKLGEKINVEDEAGDPAVLAPDRAVLIVICPTQAGQPEITEIIVLDTEVKAISANGEKVLVCHKPEKKSRHTLSLPAPAVPAHLAHGDQLGACP